MGQTELGVLDVRALRRVRWEIARFAVAVVLFLIALAFVAGNYLRAPEATAMAIGGSVGAVELLGRYRHAPLRAVLNWNGAAYVLINMGASWAAYYMLGEFKVFDSVVAAKELQHVLAAGFGSLVFMRSSLFKVRIGDADIGIGPAAILDTLLLVADRGVDRREAVARCQDVSELVAHVKDPVKVATILTKYSLALMQNVDAATVQDTVKAIKEILDDDEIPPAIKMDIVALRLGMIVRTDVLEAAVAALGDRLSQPTPNPPSAAPASSASADPPPVGALETEIASKRTS